MSWGSVGFNFLNDVISDANDMWGTGNMLDQQQRQRDAREWTRQFNMMTEANRLDASTAFDRSNQFAVDQYNRQLDYERNGIAARVEGAKAAGIHPLAALGMSQVGQIASMPMPVASPAGPSGSRGGVGRRQPNPVTMVDEEVRQLQLDNMRLQNEALENEVLSSRLALASQPGTPPPTAMQTKQITAESSPGIEIGSRPGTQYIQLPEGVFEVPSKDLKEAVEDLPLILQLYYAYRNALPKPYADESVRLAHRIKPRRDSDLVNTVRNKSYPRRMGAAGPQYYGERYRHD